jgi:intracellular multiplication protein IcmL
MADEEMSMVELRDGFYRDSFGKAIFIITSFCFTVVLLGVLVLYLYMAKPPPIIFSVENEMRVLSPVPLKEPYLSETDVVQWTVDVLPKAFNYDFIHYHNQLKAASHYFTDEGWKTFVNYLNIYANYNNVQTDKLFVSGSLAAAPFIRDRGPVQESGRYGWLVQVPISIMYAGYKPPTNKTITLQVLIVRVPTLNNLAGIGIDNVIQAPATDQTGYQAAGNG